MQQTLTKETVRLYHLYRISSLSSRIIRDSHNVNN